MSAWARKFRTVYTLDQMRDALNTEGACSWRGADNDYWGAYVVGRPHSGGKIRIFLDGEYTVIEVSGTDDPDDLVAYVSQHVFPVLGITEVEVHGGWE